MKKVTRILNHPLFIRELKIINLLEENRAYCKHNLNHFFDVARISYILLLERNIRIDKEVLYAFALLHDIGRAREYLLKRDHQVESAILAGEILRDCGYSNDEIETVIYSIKNHRSSQVLKMHEIKTFVDITRKADQLSRKCFCCECSDYCNWPEDKKNLETITI